MDEALGTYKILDTIGAGGIGTVYRARDTHHGRTVALKVVCDEIAADPDKREAFLRDARTAVTLSHPNIAALYEVGEDRGRLFLAAEFVPGQTLRSLIGGRSLNARRAIDLGIQIADALADAHASDFVHGDLRPDTILVTPKDKAKILDFGLTAWTRGGAERRAAVNAPDGALATPLGTVAYLSPEQVLGEPADHRSDIFSLGVVLFEMLTGRLPFTAPKVSDLTLQIVQAPAPALCGVNPSLPQELEPILTKALAKSLDGRYEVVAAMAAEMRAVAAILDTRADAAEMVPVKPASSASRRGRWIALVFVLALLAAAWMARGFLASLFGA